MNLLAAKLYDPGTAGSAVTTSLVAMTALDTTNLRLAFTVPAHGFVFVRLSCVHHGSTTTAQVLLGILEGSTVRARVATSENLLGTAVATTRTRLIAEFVVAGLSAGAVNWDAAYGVEIVSSAGGALKWGGPNNTTTNDAFGAFVFEIWDPQPLKIALDGGVNVTQWLGTAVATPTVAGVPEVDVTHLGGAAQSATDLKDFADDGYDPATNKVQGVVLTDTLTTYTGNTPQTGDSFARIGANGAGLTAIDLPNQTMDITGNITGNLSGSVGSVMGAVGSVTGAVGSVTGLTAANLDAAISSRASQASVDTIDGVVDGIALDAANLDVAVSTRATQTSVDTVDGIVDAILLDTAEIGVAGAGLTAINLPDQTMNIVGNITGNLSGSVGSVSGAVGSVTGAVGSVTGNVGGNVVGTVADIVATVDANIVQVNGTVIDGAGTPADPWGPV